MGSGTCTRLGPFMLWDRGAREGGASSRLALMGSPYVERGHERDRRPARARHGRTTGHPVRPREEPLGCSSRSLGAFSGPEIPNALITLRMLTISPAVDRAGLCAMRDGRWVGYVQIL